MHLVFRPMPEGRWGAWSRKERTIYVHRHLPPIHSACTIFHELGHAAMDHTTTDRREELEADVWAARHLIRPSEWRSATTAYEDLLTVADELQVLPRIAAVYAKHLARHPTIRQH